jgi:hypothetical protein
MWEEELAEIGAGPDAAWAAARTPAGPPVAVAEEEARLWRWEEPRSLPPGAAPWSPVS